MLTVMDDVRVPGSPGHAAWSESFNEMFALVAGMFGNTGGASARAGLGCCPQPDGRTLARCRSLPGMCRQTGCSGS